MRLWTVLFWLFALHIVSVFAWDKYDHEIFDLVSDLEAAEGKGTTFYSWLDVSSTATTSEIAKAYRKMSMKLHPDKNPKVKNVHERFARLGVIQNILRNNESRKRYDFFYKNGVPKWRGTGYYYQRFRPGLGTVLIFLIILSSGLQYVVQNLNYKRDLERIERFIREARAAAWGPKLIPLDGQRKVKINLGGPARLDDEGSVIAGRMIDMLVIGEEVYLLDPSGDRHLLDKNAATAPSLSNTWFLSLTKTLWRKITQASTDSSVKEEPGTDLDEIDDSGNGTASERSEPPSGTVTPREGGSKTSQISKKAAKKRKNGKR